MKSEWGVAQTDRQSLLLTVDNPARMPRRIYYAAVLVGGEEATLGSIAERAAQDLALSVRRFHPPIACLAEVRPLEAFLATDRTCAVYPLPFFFREQLDIGQESLKYRLRIDESLLQNGEPRRVY